VSGVARTLLPPHKVDGLSIETPLASADACGAIHPARRTVLKNNCNPGAIVVDSQPSGNRKAEVYTTTWTGFYC